MPSTAADIQTSKVSLICVLGAPGAGKGTQGRFLAESLGGQHISVGDLIRGELEAGRRVPRDRHSRLGDTAHTQRLILSAADPSTTLVVLDGFPRAVTQIPALLELPWRCLGVVWLNIEFEAAIYRMKARGREGESTAQIGMRHFYHDQSSPALRRALQEAGLILLEVDAGPPIADVSARCLELIHRIC